MSLVAVGRKPISARVNIVPCSGFFFNDTATTEIYTLSLHDALPISPKARVKAASSASDAVAEKSSSEAYAPLGITRMCTGDRKSTRLNSSHQIISYAVFCLKKKNTAETQAMPIHTLQDTSLLVAGSS